MNRYGQAGGGLKQPDLAWPVAQIQRCPARVGEQFRQGARLAEIAGKVMTDIVQGEQEINAESA